jgi:hypothetical protein
VDLTKDLAATIAQVILVYAIGLVVASGVQMRASVGLIEKAFDERLARHAGELLMSIEKTPREELDKWKRRETRKAVIMATVSLFGLLNRHWWAQGLLLVVGMLNLGAFIASLVVLGSGNELPRAGIPAIVVAGFGLIATVLSSLMRPIGVENRTA